MSAAPSVALVILDGFGLAPDGPGNAVSLAATPTFDGLWERYPHAQLIACGPAVGLPEGQMGNSEVGHMNLGAGAVVKQDLMRIDDAVADGSIDLLLPPPYYGQDVSAEWRLEAFEGTAWREASSGVTSRLVAGDPGKLPVILQLCFGPL